MATTRAGWTKLSEMQIAAIRQAFMESGNYSYAAKMAGVSYAITKAYCIRNLDELNDLRAKRKDDIVDLMLLVRRLALEEATDPERLKKASLSELMVVAGVMTDKINVLEGNPSTILGFKKFSNPEALTPEQREQARQLRERLKNDGLMIEGSGKLVR